jgi:hypothetical protein
MSYEILSRGFACEVTPGKCVFMTKVAPRQAWKYFRMGCLKNRYQNATDHGKFGISKSSG